MDQLEAVSTPAPSVPTSSADDVGALPLSEKTQLRHPWLAPGLLVALAFGFRMLLGHLLNYHGGDDPAYTALGRNLAAGHGYSVASAPPYLASDIRLPGYPLFLAAGFFFSGSHWSIILINSLLGALATLFIWWICRGLHLSRARALAAMGVSALFISAASVAGGAQSENLSIPAVLAFVYVVLIKPPRSRTWLFVGGSLLAWLVALTRDELVIFVFLAAVVAARRAHLRALASVALVVCFLLGSGGWLLRNEMQVHRTEYVDSLMTDSVIVATLDGQNFSQPLYARTQILAMDPATTQHQRAVVTQQTSRYVDTMLSRHLTGVLSDQAQRYVEALFPVPLFGLTYVQSTAVLGWMAWSLVVLLTYLLALLTIARWWRTGRRSDVVSLLLFPLFMLCFAIFFEPQYRFWYPAIFLVLPMAVEAVSGETYSRLMNARAAVLGERVADDPASAEMPPPTPTRTDRAGAGAGPHPASLNDLGQNRAEVEHGVPAP